jgi:hypothetical protein
MLVGEHYSFDRSNENVLGRGGFGVVYKGKDKRVSILNFISSFKFYLLEWQCCRCKRNK